MKWYKIAEQVDQLPFMDNNIALVEVNGKSVCVGRYQGNYFAFASKCPHAGGLLANGYIDVLGHVVCPLHRYKFSMSNGRNVSGEGYYLKHWLVEVRVDGVYVEMEERTGWFG